VTTPPPVPQRATAAAHEAAYSLVDDLKLHIEAAQAAEGCITSKAVRLALRVAADAALEAAAPHILARKGDPYIVGLRDGAADLRARVAELEQLASEILSRFVKTDDGHRARVGQVQIGKWETTMKGPST
jgi:hypothetical protein